MRSAKERWERENRRGPRTEPQGPPTFGSMFSKVKIAAHSWIMKSIWKIISNTFFEWDRKA